MRSATAGGASRRTCRSGSSSVQLATSGASTMRSKARVSRLTSEKRSTYTRRSGSIGGSRCKKRAARAAAAGPAGGSAASEAGNVPASCARLGRPEAHGHATRAVDEPGVEPLDRARELEVVETVQHRVEQAADLEPRQVRAEAVVGAAAAEREVRVRCAAHVEAIGRLEHLLVAVRRR